MAHHLNQDEVRKVARLARLDLTDEERIKAAADLESILAYIDRLSAVDTKEVTPYQNEPQSESLLRRDAAVPFKDRAALLGKDRFKNDLLVTKGVFAKGQDDGA